MGHRTCSSTMLYVISYGSYPICIQYMNLNLTFWYFKLWLPLKNWSWPPGPQFETIRYISLAS